MPQTPGIATLEELKGYLDISRSDDDLALQAVLDAVTERVEDYTGRLFRPDPPLDDNGNDTLAVVQHTVLLPRRLQRRMWSWTNEWSWQRPKMLTVDLPLARQVDSIAGNGVTFTSYELLNDPPWRRVEFYGLLVTLPITARPSITLTGRFGAWPAPSDIKDAVLRMSARLWRERDAEYGDVVQFAEGMTVSFFKQFPPWVQATLDAYRRRDRLP